MEAIPRAGGHADRRRVRQPLAVLLAIVLALLAFAPSGRAAPLVIAVSTESAQALPFYVAEARGFFAAEGVAVKTVGCGGGGRCFLMLRDGAAQMVTASELPVVMNGFERRDYVIVATIVTSQHNNQLLVRRSAGITEPSQLAGKRIGVFYASSAHYALDAFLLFHGVDPAAVTLVRLNHENIVQAIARGEVDAISAYHRQTIPATKALDGEAVIMKDPRIYAETFNIVTSRDTLARHGPEVVKLLRALERAERFIADEPQKAKSILVARTGFDPAFIDAVFPGYTYRLSLEQSLISTMEGQARWAVREGHVTPRPIPNYLDFIDATPLGQAVPGAVRR